MTACEAAAGRGCRAAASRPLHPRDRLRRRRGFDQLAAELRETAHKQAALTSDLRLRGALTALRNLTSSELNAAVR